MRACVPDDWNIAERRVIQLSTLSAILAAIFATTE
jgi:hypothetical protein